MTSAITSIACKPFSLGVNAYFDQGRIGSYLLLVLGQFDQLLAEIIAFE
jgi:hypothetical protein